MYYLTLLFAAVDCKQAYVLPFYIWKSLLCFL